MFLSSSNTRPDEVAPIARVIWPAFSGLSGLSTLVRGDSRYK
ncbi:hypothetical protein [Micromonospora sp. LOL_023]